MASFSKGVHAPLGLLAHVATASFESEARARVTVRCRTWCCFPAGGLRGARVPAGATMARTCMAVTDRRTDSHFRRDASKDELLIELYDASPNEKSNYRHQRPSQFKLGSATLRLSELLQLGKEWVTDQVLPLQGEFETRPAAPNLSALA